MLQKYKTNLLFRFYTPIARGISTLTRQSLNKPLLIKGSSSVAKNLPSLLITQIPRFNFAL